MMRITSAGRNRVASLICFLIASAAACTPARTLLLPREERCLNFPIRPNTPISIVSNQSDSVHLGGQNFIRIPSGALPPNQTRRYVANPIGFGPDRRAGVEILPTDGNLPTQFTRPIVLQLKYAGCPFENNSGEFVILKTRHTGQQEIIKADNDTTEKKLTVELDSFSKFAIAIN